MVHIEEAIFAGVPINVTLLFSREHYLAAAEVFLRGIERHDEVLRRVENRRRASAGMAAALWQLKRR
jgi:hypothetical protein